MSEKSTKPTSKNGTPDWGISGVVTPKDKMESNPLADQIVRHIAKSVQNLVFPSAMKRELTLPGLPA